MMRFTQVSAYAEALIILKGSFSLSELETVFYTNSPESLAICIKSYMVSYRHNIFYDEEADHYRPAVGFTSQYEYERGNNIASFMKQCEKNVDMDARFNTIRKKL